MKKASNKVEKARRGRAPLSEKHETVSVQSKVAKNVRDWLRKEAKKDGKKESQFVRELIETQYLRATKKKAA